MIQQSPLSTAADALEFLGEGGMAVVYRGQNAAGEPVAVKVLREALRGDAEAQRRFKAEYRVLTALDHPGIPTAHGQGLTSEGLPYYAMTLVRGENLENLGPVDAAEARALLAELLPILSHVHRRGLVHGDLKAENLMRGEDGRLMLMDFGLAGPAGARPHGLEGTVTHLAPELIQRGRADQRSDLYAVGVILYKWLTGRLPILGASPAETLRGQIEAPPAPPSTLVAGLDPELDGLTLRLLAKRPQDRPQSANEVLRTLGHETEEDTLALPLQAAFVGRAAMLGELLAHVSPLAAGQRVAPLLLQGANGIGKTRLLEELAQQARGLDLAVVSGRAPAGGAPWGLWRDLCRELTAVARASVPDEADALESALGPIAAAPDANAVQAFEAALVRVVQAIARRQGLLVLLDDWEHTDTASRELVLALAAKDAPTGWIFAGGPAAAFEGERRELAALEPAEVAELLQANLGAAAPAEVVEQAIAAVGGNPRFVEEWLRFMLERGRLARRHEGWALALGDGGALPKGLQALYEARLEGLSGSAIALAERVALASLPLPVSLFADGDAEALESAIAELAGKQLLSEGAEGITLHDRQLAEFLVSRMSESAVRTGHGALAAAIARHYPAPRPLAVLNALAHHASAGPDPAEARDVLLEAARENLRLKAIAEAKRFAEAAKVHAAGLAPMARIELLEILSSAHRGLDEADAALAIAEEAVALAESLANGPLLARSLNGLGKIHQLASRYDDARSAFERAAAAAVDAPLELARSHRALARLAFFAGDLPGAMQHGREAITLVRAHAEPRERAEVLAEVGETFQGSVERLQEGLACLEEAQAIARELADPFLESTAALARGNLQLGLGQLAAARISFARAAALFESQGNAGEALFARLNLALVAEEQGRFGLAEELAVAIAAEARQANRKFPLAVALAVAGSAQVHQGQTREGLKLLEEAVQVAESIQHKYLRAVIRQLEAPVRLLLGQWEAARAEATALAEFGQAAGALELVERAGLLLAELSLHAELHDELDERLAPLLSASQAGVRARAQYLRALAAFRAGDEARANQALHAARSALGELDAPRLEVDVLLVEAELRALAGDTADAPLELAQKLLEDTRQRHGMVRALAIATRLGAANQRGAARARAKELLTSLSAPLGPDQEAYLAAYGRGELLRADRPQSLQTPDTLSGLRELAQRLQEGLELIEARGVAGDDNENAQTARRLKQVVSFARAVNSSLELDMVIDCALSLVIEIAGAERGLLLLKDQSGVASQRYMAAPGHEDTAAGAEQYSRSVARTVLETGEIVCVLDALSDERFAQQASVLGLSLQTIICVPLKDHENIIGAIYVDRQGLSDQFTRADLDIVIALASLTAQSLTNARLMQAQRERQLHLEMLNRLSRTISRTLELDRVLDLIVDMTLEVTGADRAFLFLLENEEPAFGAARDREGPLPPRTALEISRSTVRQVLETQQGVYVFDAEREAFDSRASFAQLKLGSVLAVPLMGQSGLIGVLYIDSQARIVPALEREMMVLTAIANTASLAVENARLYRQATVDGLTGLFVRSLFMMRLDEEIRRAKRFGTRFSLLVMDIDHFKKFNDTYGHAVGDQVLRHVAQTLRESIRQGLDLPCRYGGEEMVLLLPETDAPGALITAERIRKAIAEAMVPGPNGEALQVTVSIGIATFPEMAETGHDLFERADSALYRSKHDGRNRTTIYEP